MTEINTNINAKKNLITCENFEIFAKKNNSKVNISYVLKYVSSYLVKHGKSIKTSFL